MRPTANHLTRSPAPHTAVTAAPGPEAPARPSLTRPRPGDPSQQGRCSDPTHPSSGCSQGQVCAEKFTGHLLPWQWVSGAPPSPSPASCRRPKDPQSQTSMRHVGDTPSRELIFRQGSAGMAVIHGGLARGSRHPSPGSAPSPKDRPLIPTVAPPAACKMSLAGDPRGHGVGWQGPRGQSSRYHWERQGGDRSTTWGHLSPSGAGTEKATGSPLISLHLGARPPLNLYFLKSFFFLFY